jgi:hypothetical protein
MTAQTNSDEQIIEKVRFLYKVKYIIMDMRNYGPKEY